MNFRFFHWTCTSSQLSFNAIPYKYGVNIITKAEWEYQLPTRLLFLHFLVMVLLLPMSVYAFCALCSMHWIRQCTFFSIKRSSLKFQKTPKYSKHFPLIQKCFLPLPLFLLLLFICFYKLFFVVFVVYKSREKNLLIFTYWQKTKKTTSKTVHRNVISLLLCKVKSMFKLNLVMHIIFTIKTAIHVCCLCYHLPSNSFSHNDIFNHFNLAKIYMIHFDVAKFFCIYYGH